MAGVRDVDFLLSVLRDGEEHELGEILQRSIEERGYGLTVHSRAADLRKRGFKVKNRCRPLPSGRTGSYYQLLHVPELDEAPASSASHAAGVSSSPGLQRLAVDDFPLAPEPGLDLADAPPRWAA